MEEYKAIMLFMTLLFAISFCLQSFETVIFENSTDATVTLASDGNIFVIFPVPLQYTSCIMKIGEGGTTFFTKGFSNGPNMKEVHKCIIDRNNFLVCAAKVCYDLTCSIKKGILMFINQATGNIDHESDPFSPVDDIRHVMEYQTSGLYFQVITAWQSTNTFIKTCPLATGCTDIYSINWGNDKGGPVKTVWFSLGNTFAVGNYGYLTGSVWAVGCQILQLTCWLNQNYIYQKNLDPNNLYCTDIIELPNNRVGVVGYAGTDNYMIYMRFTYNLGVEVDLQFQNVAYEGKGIYDMGDSIAFACRVNVDSIKHFYLYGTDYDGAFVLSRKEQPQIYSESLTDAIKLDNYTVALVGTQYIAVYDSSQIHLTVMRYKCSPGNSYDSIDDFCFPCVPGTFSTVANSPRCTDCPAGKYQSEFGKTECIACPVGNYCSGTKMFEPTKCPVGYYQPNESQIVCIKCPVGTAINSKGAKQCTDCEAGTFQNEEGKATCVNCPEGKYQDLTKQTDCKDCPAGTYTSLTKSSTCSPCSIGKFQDTPGMISCKACLIGEYQDETGKTSCKKCNAGTYQDTTSASSCKDCSAGTYSGLGANSCSTCLAGTYSTAKSPSCTNCLAGFYQNLPGQPACLPCDAGYYQPDPQCVSCIACDPGYYQDQTGQTACKQCTAGNYQSTSGKALCEPCPVGTYQPDDGKLSCLACSEGKYQDQIGKTSCLDCVSGWIPNVAKSACLYKGAFANEATFLSSKIYAQCYSSGTIAKPFTQSCRNAYHETCCQGSIMLPTIVCNLVLDLTASGDWIYNKYCGACPFMDQNKCPANGLCWDDTTWTDNNVSPYPASFSLACVEAVSSFCGPKLSANINDAECSVFKNSCGAKAISAAYGYSKDRFKITFDKAIPSKVPASCSNIFDTTFNPTFKSGSVACERTSDTEISVITSTLSSPVDNFKFVANSFKDACEMYVDSSATINVEASLIKATIILSGTLTDKCQDFTINSLIEVFLFVNMSNI